MLQVMAKPGSPAAVTRPLTKAIRILNERPHNGLMEARVTLETAATNYKNYRHEASHIETRKNVAAHVRVTANQMMAGRERTKQCVAKLLQLITDEREREGRMHQLSTAADRLQLKLRESEDRGHKQPVSVRNVQSGNKSSCVDGAAQDEQSNVAAATKTPRRFQYDLNGRRVSLTDTSTTSASPQLSRPVPKTTVALNKTVKARLSAAVMRRTLSDPTNGTACAVKAKSAPVTPVKSPTSSTRNSAVKPHSTNNRRTVIESCKLSALSTAVCEQTSSLTKHSLPKTTCNDDQASGSCVSRVANEHQSVMSEALVAEKSVVEQPDALVGMTTIADQQDSVVASTDAVTADDDCTLKQCELLEHAACDSDASGGDDPWVVGECVELCTMLDNCQQLLHACVADETTAQ